MASMHPESTPSLEPEIIEFLETSKRLLGRDYTPMSSPEFTLYPPDLVASDLHELLARHHFAGFLVVLRYLMVEEDGDFRQKAYDLLDEFGAGSIADMRVLGALRLFEVEEDDVEDAAHALELAETLGLLTPLYKHALTELVKHAPNN